MLHPVHLNPIYIHHRPPTNKRKRNKQTSLSLPSLRTLEDHSPHQTSRQSQPTHNRDTQQPLLVDLLIDQRSQTSRLHVGRLLIQQQVVVASSFAIVPQLVVPQRQIVETFSSTFGRSTEDFRQQPDAFLLVVASSRFDQALSKRISQRCLESLVSRTHTHAKLNLVWTPT